MKKGTKKRTWLTDILRSGESNILIDLESEVKSFKDAIGKGFIEESSLSASLTIRTLSFEPIEEIPRPVFWGYIFQITSYNIKIPGFSIGCNDLLKEKWTKPRLDDLKAVRNSVLSKMRE